MRGVRGHSGRGCVGPEPWVGFSAVWTLERISVRLPLRTIRLVVAGALASLDAGFGPPCLAKGPAIALERLLLASLISAGSERNVMEQRQYSLLFRWSVGLGSEDPV